MVVKFVTRGFFAFCFYNDNTHLLMDEHLSVEIELVFEAEWLLNCSGAFRARHCRVLVTEKPKQQIKIWTHSHTT